MSISVSLARNAFYLTFATVGQKIVSFATFTLIAHAVGAPVIGAYFYAVSITSLFVILGDLGLTPVVIREMAANEERGKAFAKTAIRLKAILIPIAFIASIAFVFVTHGSKNLLLSVLLACFVMSSDSLSLLFYGILRGKRKLSFEAIGLFIGQIITAIVSLIFAIIIHSGERGLILGLFSGSVWNVGWSLYHAYRLRGDQPQSVFAYRELIRAAVPFALAGVFVKVYSYFDTLLLNQYHSIAAVGWYAVAYKVTYAFQFLPLAFVASLYPFMSRAHGAQDRASLQSMLHGSLRLMLCLSIPIAVGLSVFASDIISTVYGRSFVGAAYPLAILSWVLIPIFLDFPVGSLLNATNKAHLKTRAMGFTVLINVGLNIILTPRLGPVGAAWAGLISFSCLFLFGYWYVHKQIDDTSQIVILFVRGLVAAFLLWQVFILLRSRTSFTIDIICFPFVAFIILWITGILRRQDGRWLVRFFKEKKGDQLLTSHE